MICLAIWVEGDTEEEFVKRLLADHLLSCRHRSHPLSAWGKRDGFPTGRRNGQIVT